MKKRSSRRNTRTDSELIADITAGLEELSERSKSGHGELRNKLDDLLLIHLGIYNDERTLADEQLISLADFAIPRLLEIAETQPERLQPYAQGRYSWPSYVGLPADMEKRFREAAKKIKLGQTLRFSIARKTKADLLLSLATRAVRYLTGPIDSFLSIYFAPFIDRSDKMDGPTLNKRLLKFRDSLGPLTRCNWAKWKPIFENYMTLKYGPTWKRWERIPKAWKNNLYLAIHFGVHREWNKTFGKQFGKPTLAELDAMAEQPGTPVPIMDWSHPDVTRILKRAQNRGSKWGDFQDELLKKCERILPGN